jgi:selenocysteine-specific elongation factor
MSICNVNVGVLGHVDCGKTSLVAALSEVLSTASLDKDPQSQQRGITLDLGLSAFKVRQLPARVQHHGPIAS